MKIRHYLFLALAAMMFVSCQKDGAQTPVDSGATKSVTVTIANVAPPATRVPQTGFSVAGIPIAVLTELNVLFASSDGTVVDTRSLTSQTGTPLTPTVIIDPAGTGRSYQYTFHQVPDNATKLAVSNVTVTDLDNLDSTLNGYNVYSYQAIPSASTSIPAWGFNSTWATSTATDADGFPHINAGIVDVEPKLARIEIGNIQCLNLGTATQTNGLYPRFGTLTLANIGIHGTKVGTIGGTATTYGPDAAGLTAWNTAVAGNNEPLGWNIDPVGGNVLNSTTALAGKFFGFNVVPGTAPNIILEISSATENANTNLPAGGIPGSVDPDEHYFVKSTKLNDGTTKISTFEAGYIYQVDFKFNTENVELWDGKEEFICVDVTVVIPDWVIVDTVTPGFD